MSVSIFISLESLFQCQMGANLLVCLDKSCRGGHLTSSPPAPQQVKIRLMPPPSNFAVSLQLVLNSKSTTSPSKNEFKSLHVIGSIFWILQYALFVVLFVCKASTANPSTLNLSLIRFEYYFKLAERKLIL